MEPYLNLRFGVLVEKWWLAIQVSAARDSVWLVLFFFERVPKTRPVILMLFSRYCSAARTRDQDGH